MRRKKWYRLAGIIGILLCMMVTGYVMMCAAVTASAEQVQGEFVYELSEDGKTAVLLQYKGKGGQVKVPDKLGGKLLVLQRLIRRSMAVNAEKDRRLCLLWVYGADRGKTA